MNMQGQSAFLLRQLQQLPVQGRGAQVPGDGAGDRLHGRLYPRPLQENVKLYNHWTFIILTEKCLDPFHFGLLESDSFPAGYGSG